MMDLKQRFDRLDSMIAEGRLLRKQWTESGEEGKERACLLAALSPEVAKSHSSGSCPADIIPAWLAQLTPAMDDNGTLGEWSAFVRRYSQVIRSASEKLTEEQWNRVQYRVRIGIIQESMKHVRETDTEVLASCRTVVSLCEQAADGNNPNPAAWSAAESAAESAARSAAESAAWSAAWSAAESAARSAAWSAAESAAESAARSAAWSAARSAAWSAARSAAWDRLNTMILDTIEAEVSRG